MTRLEDSREAEIAMLSHEAPNIAGVDRDIRVACRSKLFHLLVLNSQRDCFAANPVAGVVAITVDHVDFDSVVNQLANVLHEACSRVVASILEGVIWCIATRIRVVDWDSKCSLNMRLIQVADVEVSREWVQVYSSDVIITSARIKVWS